MSCSTCRPIPIMARSAARDREAMIAGARVEVAPYKRDPADFVLWKPSDRGRDRLGQPVGPGPAGLAYRMLGDDPRASRARRSTSTAAGSTSSSRTTRMRSRRAAAPMAARRWRATGCTTASSTWAREKMSKSLGNVVTVGELLARRAQGRGAAAGVAVGALPPAAAWTESLIAQSKATLDRLYRVGRRCRSRATVDAGVLEALGDDLNTPLALSRLGRRSTIRATPARRSGELLGLLGDERRRTGSTASGDAGDRSRRCIAARAEAKSAARLRRGRPHPRRAEGRGHPA